MIIAEKRIGIAPVAEGRHPQQAKVLLVEDDPVLLELACMCIGESGDHRITICEDGKKAVEAIRQQEEPFDAAVLDFHAGIGPDGVQLASLVREHSPQALVVLYTANAQDLAKEGLTSRELGVDAVMRKDDIVGLCNLVPAALARNKNPQSVDF